MSNKNQNNKIAKNNCWLSVGFVMGFALGYKLWLKYKARQNSPLLRGKEMLWATVIGASSGIGPTYARKLAGIGYDLILVAQGTPFIEQIAEDLVSEYQVKVRILTVDLATSEGLEQVESIIASQDNMNFLVNNVALDSSHLPRKVERLSNDERIHRQVTTSLRLTRAALPGMLARKRGAIVNVSSSKINMPFPGSTPTSYLNAFTMALHRELAGSGVRVQSLSQGFIHSDNSGLSEGKLSRINELVWLQPENVVDRSLRDLANDRVISIPVLFNRLLLLFAPYIPRNVINRLSRLLTLQNHPKSQNFGFRKRTWSSLSDFANDMRYVLRNIHNFQHIKELDNAFMRRLILMVTYVNDCRYCASFHTKTALMDGVQINEVEELLQGIVDNVPEDELPALLYAQYWAELGGYFDSEVRQNMVDRYGLKKTQVIESVLQLIKIGNYTGNALNYLFYTISGGRWGNSTN